MWGKLVHVFATDLLIQQCSQIFGLLQKKKKKKKKKKHWQSDNAVKLQCIVKQVLQI